MTISDAYSTTHTRTQAERLAILLGALRGRLAVAESCTGGLIAATCTSIPGSSSWFELGAVTYSNHSKTNLLAVSADLLERFGAVSTEVATAMASGVLLLGRATCSLAVTGIAGPSGGSDLKPVGLVCFAWRVYDEAWHAAIQFVGDRDGIRQQATAYALQILADRLELLKDEISL